MDHDSWLHLARYLSLKDLKSLRLANTNLLARVNDTTRHFHNPTVKVTTAKQLKRVANDFAQLESLHIKSPRPATRHLLKGLDPVMAHLAARDGNF